MSEDAAEMKEKISEIILSLMRSLTSIFKFASEVCYRSSDKIKQTKENLNALKMMNTKEKVVKRKTKRKKVLSFEREESFNELSEKRSFGSELDIDIYFNKDEEDNGIEGIKKENMKRKKPIRKQRKITSKIIKEKKLKPPVNQFMLYLKNKQK